MEIVEVAQCCHEANRVVQAVNGDTVNVSWPDLPLDQQERILNGVTLKLRNPEVTAEDMHVNWMKDMLADGYTLGAVIDHEQKIHPNLVNYADLPLAQQLKDDLFSGIVGALRNYTT